MNVSNGLRMDVRMIPNADLIAQFEKCKKWNDADQWDILGALYFNRGFILNAGVCFQRADDCRGIVHYRYLAPTARDGIVDAETKGAVQHG